MHMPSIVFVCTHQSVFIVMQCKFHSLQLKQLGDALRTDRNPLPNQNTELTPVLQALGDSLENKLDQIAALILAAEACSGRLS